MRKGMIVTATMLALAGVAACNSADAPTVVNDSADANVQREGDAADAIRARQANFKEMARASKAIGDQLKARNPSIADIQASARILADHAPRILTWFPAGSGEETGARTRAKAEIWSNPEGFGEAAARFIATSETFNMIAGTGDVDAIRTAQADLGPSCRNCHDRFRGPEVE